MSSESGESPCEDVDVFLLENKRWLCGNTSSFIELNENSFFEKMLLKSYSSFSISGIYEKAGTDTSNSGKCRFLSNNLFYLSLHSFSGNLDSVN